MQEIPAVKLVKIFKFKANLKWVLFIRNVRGGRDLFAGIVLMQAFTQRQELSAMACLNISTTLSEAGDALIETQH